MKFNGLTQRWIRQPSVGEKKPVNSIILHIIASRIREPMIKLMFFSSENNCIITKNIFLLTWILKELSLKKKMFSTWHHSFLERPSWTFYPSLPAFCHFNWNRFPSLSAEPLSPFTRVRTLTLSNEFTTGAPESTTSSNWHIINTK